MKPIAAAEVQFIRPSQLIFFNIIFFSLGTIKSSFDFSMGKPLYYDHGQYKSMLARDDGKNNFLWHLKSPYFPIMVSDKNNEQDLLWNWARRKGQGVRVAILDHACDYKKYNEEEFYTKKSHKDENGKSQPNLTRFKQIGRADVAYNKSDKRGASTGSKNEISSPYQFQYHGAISAGIIHQIAPEATIIFIDVFDEHGTCDKKKFLQGLSQAYDLKVDIIHLGLKIEGTLSSRCKEDRAIIKLLKKASKSCYIVAAAGNDRGTQSGLSTLASTPSIKFSVGAYEKKGDDYKICNFSQYNCNRGPNFILPGAEIICPLWSAQLQDFIFISVSGTSMASAIMSGFLALIISEHGAKFKQNYLFEVIKKCSLKLDQSWEEKVTYGMIDSIKVFQKL